MELKDTVEKMTSADYEDRFIAEYQQTKIRYEELKAFNEKLKANKRAVKKIFEVYALSLVMEKQQKVMESYLEILQIRAYMEGIKL